jgi:cell division protein FtsA
MKSLSELLFGKDRPEQGDVFAALDIGSSKIACFIARADEDGQPRVVGIGHHVSEGIRGGLISNMERVQRTIVDAVATAEQMAGGNIERVIVNVASPQLFSQTVEVDAVLNGREIVPSDLDRLQGQAQALQADDPATQSHGVELIHTIPVHYALDGQKGIRDPIGMIGNNLRGEMNLVSASFGPVRTLVTAVARCHLEVERLIATPYASGLSCLVEDEMDLGCTVIDMGAGTTSLGIFFDGRLIYAGGIAIGGAHITNDIARGLTTPVAHAERLKTLFGSALLTPMDDREIIDVPQVGEEDPAFANHLPKSHLIKIIQPRLEEIFELARAQLIKSGFNDVAGRRVVLTGGGSQLPGVRDVAGKILDKQVRLGRPIRITRPYAGATHAAGPTGLAEATSGPAFATTAGLLAVAMQPELALPADSMDYAPPGFMSRMTQWLRGGFSGGSSSGY